MKSTAQTATDLETLARKLAADLGLPVTVRGHESTASAKLGRQVRLSVSCVDKRKTWSHLRKLGRALSGKVAGRVFTDKHSHFETREGVLGGCNGWATGSQADLRIYLG